MLYQQKKKQYYNQLKSNSTNKQKTTWNIVKGIANNTDNTYNLPPMNISNELSNNPTATVNALNSYQYQKIFSLKIFLVGKLITMGTH